MKAIPEITTDSQFRLKDAARILAIGAIRAVVKQTAGYSPADNASAINAKSSTNKAS